MSASREKQNRQEQQSSGWVDPKTAREAEQRKKEKRSSLLYGAIAVVFVVVAVLAIIYRTNLVPKVATAATIDGEKYTAAEVSFYYLNAYQNLAGSGYAAYMGLDTSASLSAYEVVNTWSQEELRRILYEYGEERYAPAIAKAIVRARETAPVNTTLELVEIIRGAMPPAALREKQHPAKRSFQAIRIAVNGELDALPPMLEAAVDGLNPGGRLAVITFHSLEDRIVKRTLADLAKGCTCPPEFPVCVCGRKPRVRLVNRKPVTADGAELADNPRARSAKLRVAEKCDPFDI